MSILKNLLETLKLGFLSDSSVKKLLHESGISPERDYKKEIAENTRLMQEQSERMAEELKKLAKAMEELAAASRTKE